MHDRILLYFVELNTCIERTESENVRYIMIWYDTWHKWDDKMVHDMMGVYVDLAT